MFYFLVKYFHIFLATLSVSLFNFRYLYFFNRERPKHTFLLISGIVLVLLTGLIPFTKDSGWLVVKLFLLVGYIFFGIWAMRSKGTLKRRVIGYILANIIVIEVFILAINK